MRQILRKSISRQLAKLPGTSLDRKNIGPQDKTRNTLNSRPVVPFQRTKDWLLITRTIMPVIAQPNTFANTGGVVPTTQDAGECSAGL
ncbi:hypothetical protein W02_17680 [Nitrospira sp. KM1]|uniref:hypothetical protein n=1 Tax=Nitrospira sp. KM1 TaxID=1936990 RepID=UPI0013A74679|nr:hypothetical protein [Nitrospira sp. KM1]BCA54628.1 hypothetical protein W02_17680 [Nitrospira sp. KM1]